MDRRWWCEPGGEDTGEDTGEDSGEDTGEDRGGRRDDDEASTGAGGVSRAVRIVVRTPGRRGYR